MSIFLGLLAGMTILGQADAGTLYARDFQGEFAPKGSCAMPTEHWVFTARDVTQGKIACQVASLSSQDGHVIVATRNCTKNGQPLPDRYYSLDLMSEDMVKVQVGETASLLQRCPTNR